jgi:predicted PurR-regulated permease PerM
MTTQHSSVIESAVQIGLIALLALWCFQIAAPFIAPVVWAGIIAIGAYPLYLLLRAKTSLGAGWASTIVTLVLLAVLITPTVVLSNALIDNAQTLSTQLANDELKIPPPPDSVGKWPIVGENLEAIWLQASLDPRGTFGQFEFEIKELTRWLLSAVAGASLTILVFIFSIIIAGVFMASADGAKEAIVAIFTRLAGDRGPELTELSVATVKSVVTGILGIALIQAILAGLGFLAMDIPAAGVLAFICLILAIVQIDILIILIPLSIYAFTDSGTAAAVAFLVWNIAVGLLNNVLKPILLAKGVDAPMAIIFVGAIGGMILSGIIGLFVGAVVMVLGYTLFMAWLKTDVANSNAG